MASEAVLGSWIQGSERFLDAALKKATGGSSAIARGKVCVADANGVYAVAATGSKGEFAVCTHTNVDADATFTGMKNGGIVFVRADGAIKPHKPVEISGSTAGEVVAYVAPTVSGSPTQAEVQNARDAFTEIVGFYKGHVDEDDGSADRPITDAADGDIIKIQLVSSR